ncbi:MAG TPA: dihydrodipicolinate synthase family protein [Longimicrobiales bacterium]|nr:dihydrodipicolinate synthase family protein [Longimicrobiales bacterium]
MSTSHTRRDAVKIMGAAALGATLPAPLAAQLAARRRPARAAAEGDLRGLFVILSTPYTESGAVDYDDLAFQVEWLEQAGVHGLVWPQNSSDYPRLTEDEIRQGMETLAQANRGRSTALVLGVQRDSTREMVDLATFAETLEPDMMIAMPPKVGSSLEDYRAYYTALARVTSRPVMMQTQPNLPGVEFDTDFILELAERYPHLGYVKEEAQPVFDRISALVGQAPIQRVYSAMRGRYFAYDLRLGVDGLVSGMSMYADVFARMWDAYRADDWDEVRDIHGRLLVMLTCEQEIPGAGRYLLHRRGIFRTRRQRGVEHRLSPVQIDEIEHNLRGLEPYLVGVPTRRA